MTCKSEYLATLLVVLILTMLVNEFRLKFVQHQRGGTSARPPITQQYQQLTKELQCNFLPMILTI
jgi:hypothetical protein